jgi:hypothetical protein
LLRDDDRDTLIGYCRRLGMGHLNQVPARAGSQPQVRWDISSKIECARLAELLDAHPLRGRKLIEYEIWREAVTLWAARRYGFAAGGANRIATCCASESCSRLSRFRAPDETRHE